MPPSPPPDAALLARGLDACVIGAALVDVQQDDWPLVYVNPAFEHLTGYPAAEVLGRNCRFLQGTDRNQPGRATLRAAIRSGVPVTVILRNYRKDGTLFLNELTLSPLHDAAGTVTHVMGFQHDVTARETALNDAAQAARHLQATLDHLPDPFIAFDRRQSITYANAAATATFGVPAGGLLGTPLADVFPDASDAPFLQVATLALDTGGTQHVSAYSASLGRELEVTAYATDGGAVVTLRDVTRERRAQQEVLDSQERFSKVFDASPLAIVITRLADGQYVDANPAFLRLSGHARADVIGHTSEDLHLWADPAERAAVLETLQRRGEVLDRAVSFRLRSGEICAAILSVVPVTLAGEPCVITLVRDVRAETVARERLLDSERRHQQTAAELQRTLDLSLDVITSIDPQGRFLSVSAASQRLLGYPPEAMIGQPYLTFVHPEDRERSTLDDPTDTPPQGKSTFQNRYVHRDGRVVWLDWTSVRLRDGVTYATARDVTERRAATEDQAFLAAIVRASTDAIVGLALDGTVRSWNSGAERMYGYPAEDVIGSMITAIVPPDLQDEERQLLDRAARGDSTPAIETTRVSRTGVRLPVQLSVAPIFDHAGVVVGISKIAQDITARHDAQRQILQLNAQLERQLGHLSSLREIDQAIASSLDLTVILGVVLDHVRRQVDADAVTVLLLDPHDLNLNYAGTRGFLTASPQGHAVRLGDEVAGRVALTRQSVVLGDVRGLPVAADWQALLEREGLTAYAAVPLIAKGKVLGVIEVLRRQAFGDASGWLDTLQTLAGQAAIAVDNAQLFLELEHRNLELGLAYQETIEGWARALDLRDRETEGHSRRVTDLTVDLCRALGVGTADLVHVRRGALLHDIGKMGISDAILLKPGPLTDEEWVEMRRHPGYAVDLLSPIQFLQPALDIPRSHHEKWDGSGYPQGLRGTAIPLTSRAFAVVDVYDALTNDRPYRAAWTHEQALAHLAGQAGTHFDPEIVQAFLRLHAQRPPSDAFPETP